MRVEIDKRERDCTRTPIGSAEFVRAHGEERIEKERRLLAEIELMEDVQEAWALLLHCAVPRANHSIRTIQPSLAAPYAKAHDDAIWSTFNKLIGGGKGLERNAAGSIELPRLIAAMPGARGGLGLTSATRTSEAAYWASWVDALSVFNRKSHELTTLALRALGGELAHLTCASEAAQVRDRLVAMGVPLLPTWRDAANGARAPQPQEELEAGFTAVGNDMLVHFSKNNSLNSVFGHIAVQTGGQCFFHRRLLKQVAFFVQFRRSGGSR